MGLWQILKGEQPGLLKSLLHYRNAGQFGEYLIDYALQSKGIEGERVVLTNLYLPMKGKTTEIDCTVCGEVSSTFDVTPKKDHTWDDGVVTTKPTAEKEGVKTYTCKVCNETKTETIPRLNSSGK